MEIIAPHEEVAKRCSNEQRKDQTLEKFSRRNRTFPLTKASQKRSLNLPLGIFPSVQSFQMPSTSSDTKIHCWIRYPNYHAISLTISSQKDCRRQNQQEKKHQFLEYFKHLEVTQFPFLKPGWKRISDCVFHTIRPKWLQEQRDGKKQEPANWPAA